jgi:hypothetical protein
VGVTGTYYGDYLLWDSSVNSWAVGSSSVSIGQNTNRNVTTTIVSTTPSIVGALIAGGTASEYSGYSVSLSSNGNTVAIGAYGYSTSTGATRIYDLSGNTWALRGALIAGGTAGEASGRSVSLSSDGNTVAIGAVGYDVGLSNCGATRIYDWSGAAWVLRGALIAGGTAGENSGGLSR